jgi:hypothetical protein
VSAARRIAGALALALALPAALGGCGYSRALSAPPGAASVGVTFFANDTPVRDLERELAVELAASVRDLVQTPLAEPQRADVRVEGRLGEYRRRGGIRDPENRLLESGVQVLVEAWLVDARTGEPLTAVLSATTAVGYLIPEPGGEEQARSRALRHLADRIVLDLFHPAALVEVGAPGARAPGPRTPSSF